MEGVGDVAAQDGRVDDGDVGIAVVRVRGRQGAGLAGTGLGVAPVRGDGALCVPDAGHPVAVGILRTPRQDQWDVHGSVETDLRDEMAGVAVVHLATSADRGDGVVGGIPLRIARLPLTFAFVGRIADRVHVVPDQDGHGDDEHLDEGHVVIDGQAVIVVDALDQLRDDVVWDEIVCSRRIGDGRRCPRCPSRCR